MYIRNISTETSIIRQNNLTPNRALLFNSNEIERLGQMAALSMRTAQRSKVRRKTVLQITFTFFFVDLL